MTFSIVIMVGRGYFLPTHVHEASDFLTVNHITITMYELECLTDHYIMYLAFFSTTIFTPSSPL
jgi:hypothetical protein